MPNLNKVMLMGNITRDPELTFIPSSNTPVCKIGLACNRKFKRQNGEQGEETLFVDCTAFGRTAEVINQYLKKGRPIFIEGRLKLDQWEDKQSGQKRSKHQVVIENFQFIDGGGDGESRGGGGGQSSRGDSGPPPPSDDDALGGDDIPF